jgi:hypothetical protein
MHGDKGDGRRKGVGVFADLCMMASILVLSLLCRPNLCCAAVCAVEVRDPSPYLQQIFSLHPLCRVGMLGLVDVLGSSYGPQGRSKVLKGATGVTIITKDCQQLIEQFSESLEPWDQFHLKTIKKYSRRYGDGAMTLLILISTLLHKDQQIIEATSPSSITYRSQSLVAISILSDTIHSLKDAITDTFIQLYLWKRVAISTQLIEMICRHLLVPAANPAIASNLTHILVIGSLAHPLIQSRSTGFTPTNGLLLLTRISLPSSSTPRPTSMTSS